MDTKFVSNITGVRQIASPVSQPKPASVDAIARPEETTAPRATEETPARTNEERDGRSDAIRDPAAARAELDDVVQELNRHIQQRRVRCASRSMSDTASPS